MTYENFKNRLADYKKLGNDAFRYASMLLCYYSIDTFVENPTEEEYGIISNACYQAYMRYDEVDLVKLTDRVSEAYENGDITLSYIRNATKKELVDKFYDWSEYYED